jgi:YVTN family beta-propeller protein
MSTRNLWTIRFSLFVGLSLSALFAAKILGPLTSEDYLSPNAIIADPNEEYLYIAGFTKPQIMKVNVATQKVSTLCQIPHSPSGIAISPDNKYLYVTGVAAEGKVYIIEISSGMIISTINVGHTPTAPVVSPDGKILYVCNQFNDNVSVIDLKSKEVVSNIPVLRQPCAAAITPNGAFLFVNNLLQAGAADGSYASAAVSVIDTSMNKVATSVQLPNGSTSLRGITGSPDGKYVYATHILARYQIPTTQLERGWMNTNALSIIDVASQKYINTVLLDDVDLGAANPWAVACTKDGKYICVTHAGTHELSIFDRVRLHEKLNAVVSGEKVADAAQTAADVPIDLSFLVDVRRRVKLNGNGPRGLAIIGSMAYITEYFTDSMSIVNILGDEYSQVKSLLIGPQKELSAVRKGEMFFNDAALCFQHWQSCASCHPDQARADALNWDLLNDGIGNPKNTKSLLFSHVTPPVMITGIRKDAKTAVRTGIRYIQFAVRPEEDVIAMDDYLKSLEPVPSPHLVKGKLNPAAKRGKILFESTGCLDCHSGPYYTDMKQYDVGVGTGRDKGVKFDTPTLIEVWRTAPYLYDGKTATMKEVLTKFNKDDKHGKTSDLNDTQINDLVEYILSL